MRTLHPEIRKLSISSKLKYSFFISIIAFIFAIVSSVLYGPEFLFVTFPLVAFLVYIFDKIIFLPHNKVVRKIAIPVWRKK